MIERVRDEFLASCDSCSNTLDIQTSNFNEAVSELKDNGWRIKKIDGVFNHTCPVCLENEND